LIEILNVLSKEYEIAIERLENNQKFVDKEQMRKSDSNLLEKEYNELKNILIERDELIAKLKNDNLKMREESLHRNEDA